MQQAEEESALFNVEDGNELGGPDIETGVAFDAFVMKKNGLHIAVQAALDLDPPVFRLEAQLHFDINILEALF